MFKICAISDTHWSHNRFNLGSGNLLIHSGDAEIWSEDRAFSFARWLSIQDYRHIIFVPGNHDTWIEEDPEEAHEIFEEFGIHMLIDESMKIEGFKIYGSPYTPTFGHWSFMEAPTQLKERWRNIPIDTDILITHGPPQYILDSVGEYQGNQGCQFLMQKVAQMSLILHFFGHIHEGYGTKMFKDILFVNSAICPTYNGPREKMPFIIELEDRKVNDFYPMNWR